MASSQVSVEVPYDVEALVVNYLLANGKDAQSELGEDRTPGTVRVTRAGGDLEGNGTQDVPKVLVEVWGTTAIESWDQAIEVWALLVAARELQAIGGVQLDDVELDVPRTLDDEFAPELHRNQFLAELRLETTSITINVEGVA